MNHPGIMPELRNHPFVVTKIAEGKDLADIFFEFHLKAVNITEEECERYNINKENANRIVEVIKTFVNEMYKQKQNGTLFDVREDFPPEAMEYNRNK